MSSHRLHKALEQNQAPHIRIIVADSHRPLRTTLTGLIHKLVKGEVVAEVETGLEAVESTRRLLPDILLVDVNLPDMSGIEVTRAVASWEERVKVIVLSTYRDKRYLSEALKSGASGFLIKDCVHEELGTAIDTVTHDGTYLSPKMSETD